MRASVERCLAVGVFDGVHLGHRKILEGATAALTFSRHPLSVLDPASAPKLIMSLEDRIAAIRDCGIEDVCVLDFTEELAKVPAQEFASAYFGLGGMAGAVKIRCGGNWRFGRNGEGDAEWLRKRGLEVEVVPYAQYGDEAVSSSRIRRLLGEGDIYAVNAMLGRRYSISGVVVQGKGEGRNIGFPTLNINTDSLLRRGVYEVELGGVKGIANYGLAPTMAENAWNCSVLEVHIPGTDSVATGTGPLRVEFLRFIRPERKFSSVAELCRQIAQDIRSVMPS
jgi:riboflavin kinase/FMN adenylyltransferase